MKKIEIVPTGIIDAQSGKHLLPLMDIKVDNNKILSMTVAELGALISESERILRKIEKGET